MHAEQSQAMKGIIIQKPFEEVSLKRKNTIGFKVKDSSKKPIAHLNNEEKLMELLEPVVEAYDDDNYHELLSAVDDLFTDFNDNDFALVGDNLENGSNQNFENNIANAKFSNKDRTSSAYNTVKYASGGPPYPQGRYA
mmetsp:Transcript_23374/g.20771  ORF Transcript_23374/g.20771 Transcript_23374/m.20771 type:complete len:138 (+) Transcript_23374:28-441(+)